LHGALLDSELLADVYLRLTGGQVSLDFENQARVPVQDEVTTVVAVQQSKQPTSSVRVLKASPEEVEAHNNYLKTLQSEQSDQSCLWFEVESNS
jgi:DNA polymerase-3 subunit epsilon